MHQRVNKYICNLLLLGVTYVATENYTYRSYNQGVLCSTQFGPPLQPNTVDEIQFIVLFARAVNLTVKVIGSQHSLTDIICTEGFLTSLVHFTNFSFNETTKRIRAGAGLEVKDFLDLVHNAGCGITGEPTFGGITLGGAIAVGVHGTGILHPTLLSDQMTAMSFVDGEGNVRHVEENDEMFDALRVSLGLLGIIYNVEFVCQPRHKLTMNIFPRSDDILRDGAVELLNMVKTHDVFQFWWFPTNNQVVLSLGNQTGEQVLGNCQTNYISNLSPALALGLAKACESIQAEEDHEGMFLLQSYGMLRLYRCMPGVQPFYSQEDGQTLCLPPATGWRHKMSSNKCDQCAWLNKTVPLLTDDNCIAIPLKHLPEALDVLKAIFDSELVAFPLNGLYFRFLQPGNGLLAINKGKVGEYWVSIEWITVPRKDKCQPKLGTSVYQKMAQVLIHQFEGRSHWGKAGFVYKNAELILKSHGEENVEAFKKVMTQLDPHGTFMNTLGMRIKSGKSVYTTDPALDRCCALNEYCFCTNNQRDCGDGLSLDRYSCQSFSKLLWSICTPPLIQQINANIQRNVVNGLAKLEELADEVLLKLNLKFGLFELAPLCGAFGQL